MAVYLDFKDAISSLGEDTVRSRYGNLFQMYSKITGDDPYHTPMRIYPAVHYTMGGLWVDYNLMKSNFSLGLNISNEFEEVYKLSTSHLSPSFSYEINLNYNWVLRSGAQFSIVDSRLKNDLIFLDQFNPDGTIGISAENLMVYGNRNYLSLAMGMLAYSEKIWIGGSIYNLNEPNVSFTNEKINLDRLYSFHIGFTIDKFKMSPSLHFKKQSLPKQLQPPNEYIF